MTATRPGIDIAELLRHASVLSRLPEPARIGLARVGVVERFAKPTLINGSGQPLRSLRLVVRGHIELITRRTSGEELVVAEIGPGGWATWVGCFAPQLPERDLWSSGDACFLALPTQAVRTAALAHPEVFLEVIADMAVRTRQLLEWVGDSVMLTPEQRMAKLLHLLARSQGARGGQPGVQVTQARLAQLARCSRQSANTLLAALERRGLVTGRYGRFEIPDLSRLKAFIDAEQVEPD